MKTIVPIDNPSPVALMSELHKRLKAWKPIHLCWWFEKHNLPIPPYFVGGAANRHQTHWILGDDDNADPDLCTWDVEDTARTSQAKETPFMIRIQVSETGGGNWNNFSAELYYNTVDDISTATQVTTTSSIIQITDGTPLSGTATTQNVMTAQALTWVDGEYTESDVTGNLTVSSAYTEVQWCVQFTAAAGDNQTYYFWFKYSGGTDLEDYPATTINITTAPALAVTHELNATAEGDSDASVNLTAVSFQHLYPASDSYVGAWTDQNGNTGNLYTTIDEETPSDTDYVRSERSPSNSPAVFKLETGGDPKSSIGHRLSYRYMREGDGVIDLTVELREGYVSEASQGALIASWQHNNVGETITQADQDLSEVQADSITDYSDLHVRFVAS